MRKIIFTVLCVIFSAVILFTACSKGGDKEPQENPTGEGEQNYTLTINVSGEGTVSGAGEYAKGTLATITATASSGYVFEGWYKNAELLDKKASYAITVNEDTIIEARFKSNNPLEECTLTLDTDGNGAASGGGKYAKGATADIKATPNSGYEFEGWYKNEELIAESATYGMVVTEDITIEARFKQKNSAGDDTKLDGVSFKDGTLTADGKAKSLYISGELPQNVSVAYSGNGKTAVGEYTVTATFTDTVTLEEVGTKTAVLKIIAAAAPPAPDTKVYCTADWASVYCYTWRGEGGAGNQNAAWPGVAMTAEGNKTFSYEIDSSYENLIFNSGANGEQTKNITAYPIGSSTYKGYKYDVKTDKWTSVSTAPTAPTISANRYAGSFRSQSVKVKIIVDGASYSTYSIDGGEIYSFSGSQSFSIGEDLAIGESVTIEVKANGEGGESSQNFTYTKKESRSGDVSGISAKYRTYYQLLVYSFADGNGDGIGDFLGLIEKLDYLADMGITGLWLSPINKSTSYHSYDVEDYYSIKSDYEVTVGGTKYDFDRLLAECAERGIVVIMDLVVNHTSSSHPWFTDAANNASSPYRNWYSFTNSFTQRCVRQYKGGNTWYEGVFADTMPDLNFDNPEVRAEMIKVAKYWMEKGVAGFRLDAALMVYTSDYADPFRNFDNKKNFEWWNEFYSGVAAEYPSVYMVGETWDQFIDTYQTTVDYYADGMDSSFSFRTKFEIQNALEGEANFAKWLADFQKAIRTNQADAIEAQMLDNHDMVRFTSLVTDLDMLKSAAAMQILSPGNAFIFYGDELALCGVKGDGYDDQAYRTPMLWGDGDANLCYPGQYMNGNATAKSTSLMEKNAAQQVEDANSMYSYYKNLIALKNSVPSLYVGSITALNTNTNYISAFVSSYNDNEIIVVHNTADSHGTLRLPEGSYQIVGSLSPSGKQAYFSGTTLNLPQYCSAVIKVNGSLDKAGVSGSTGHGSGENTTNASGGGGGNATILHCKKYDGWTTAKIYTWTGTDTVHTGVWPGTAMKDDGNGWYSYTVDMSVFNVIFNSGVVDADRSGKTDDLQVSEGGEYWFADDCWYTKQP